MANDKLPHERLREWADDGERNETFPSVLMDKELVGGFVEDSELYDVIAFRKLADDIERFYIPRPRYGDGEPVQFGDDADELNGVEKFIFLRSCGGCCQMQDAEGNMLNVFPGGFVKRPAPKVLDADGVPIEVGDWVYTEAGLRRKVAKVGTERCLGMEDWDGSPWVMFGNGSWMHAHDITHREPDSLERLRDDIAAYNSDFTEPGSILEDALDGWAQRLTALIERGAE